LSAAGSGRTGAYRLDDGKEGGRRRPWWLGLLLLAALLLAGLLLLSQCTGGADDEVRSRSGGALASPSPTPAADASGVASGSAEPSAGSTATAESSATASASASATGGAGGAAGGGAAGDAGVLTAGGTSLLPLSGAAPEGDLSSYAGQQATGQGVLVQSVPADEGFWVGSSETDRVWVQLTGASESPFQVTAGQRVSFTSTVESTPSDFPAQLGVDEAEGAEQLMSQRQHLRVDRSTLELAG